MLTLVAKRGNKILKPTDMLVFNPYHKTKSESVSVAQVIIDLHKVYDVFFPNTDIGFKIMAGWSNARYHNTTGGIAFTLYRRIEMYTQKYATYLSFLQNCYHEFGHIYHIVSNSSDFHSRTSYGKEIYAEEFANACLGSAYSDDSATNYTLYDGYKTKTMYNQPHKEFIRKQIKPLT